jgi:hypothetical protein
MQAYAELQAYAATEVAQGASAEEKELVRRLIALVQKEADVAQTLSHHLSGLSFVSSWTKEKFQVDKMEYVQTCCEESKLYRRYERDSCLCLHTAAFPYCQHSLSPAMQARVVCQS